MHEWKNRIILFVLFGNILYCFITITERLTRTNFTKTYIILPYTDVVWVRSEEPPLLLCEMVRFSPQVKKGPPPTDHLLWYTLLLSLYLSFHLKSSYTLWSGYPHPSTQYNPHYPLYRPLNVPWLIPSGTYGLFRRFKDDL